MDDKHLPTNRVNFITTRIQFLKYVEELICHLGRDTQGDFTLEMLVENLMTETKIARDMNRL